MAGNFKEDLKNAKKAEYIGKTVLQLSVLMEIKNEYDYNNMSIFIDVSYNKKYWHKGDIECTRKSIEDKIYIDVKDDGRISSTGNVFAEDRIYWKNLDETKDGFMRNSEYDYVAVVSQPDRRIYILDFRAWKKYYQDGRYVEAKFSENISYGYVMSLGQIRQLGILVAEIDYEYGWFYDGDGIPFPVRVERVA